MSPKRKINHQYLDFSHKKFTNKASEYRNEVSNVTSDMLTMVRKSNRSLAVCEGIVSILGSKERPFRVNTIENEAISFKDLLFDIENFTFRLHGYRDKLCIFINHVMRLGYDESDTGLLTKLINHGDIKKSKIDTELKKFQTGDLSTVLRNRKFMTHKIYYDSDYNPLFIPDENPQEIGFYKAAQIWKKQMKKEVNSIDVCMEKIFEINTKISEKLIVYLDNN